MCRIDILGTSFSAGEPVKRHLSIIGILIAFLVPVAPAAAQSGAPSQKSGADPAAAKESSQQTNNTSATGSGSATSRFLKDVGSDYKNFFSKETAIWYGAGLAAAGLVHLADEDIRDALADPPEAVSTALEGGDKYGNLTFQLPLAVGWWACSHAFGSARGAEAGRDLLRAQINAVSWTYAIKFAVNRDRPNGDKRSFPSGHASATFATAMVLQQHYGWKIGVPFFLGATYTGFSRIRNNKHWASDVVFGAAVGMASARTVTLHVRKRKITLVPVAVPGGAGLALVRLD
jgi:membrane-associated phospholipid phosphatase